MNLRPRTLEILRQRLAGARGWLIPAALLALAPKCVLCVLAYAGLGAALGFGGPELCGATGDATISWVWLPALGAAVGIARLLLRPAKGQRLRPVPIDDQRSGSADEISNVITLDGQRGSSTALRRP